MWRIVLGVVIGAIVAFAVVGVVETVGHVIYPPPDDLDWHNPQVLKEYVATLPTAPLLFPLGGWLLGTLLGGWAGALIAGRRALLVTGLIALLMLLATGANLAFIPHPLWITLSALVGIPLFAWLACHLPGARVAVVRAERS